MPLSNTQRTEPARFPRLHLLLVLACTCVLFASSILLPSQDVSANRAEPPADWSIEEPADTVLELTQTTTEQAPTSANENDLDSVASQPSVTSNKAALLVDDAVVVKSPTVLSQEVRKGDTLTHVFDRAGIGLNTMYNLIGSHTDIKKRLTAIKPGQRFDFYLDEADALTKLIYASSLTESYIFEQQPDGSAFSMTKDAKELSPKLVYSGGVIESSLFLSGTRAGVSERIIMELANIFAWDIDFALDIRQGDSFKIIYEELYLGDQKVREGNILAAEFTNRGQTYTSVRYTDSNGKTGYYAPNGDSMRKAFLRSPVEFARISSHFNLRRRHPVLHTIRAHKGTDYAAPTGTPIRAAGDGKVHFAGRKGGYGNVVILQHGEQYRTLYAHLHRFKRGIKSGRRVSQGDIIGYVGSSGLATGPHLHYEFYENGRVRNPVTVKLPNAEPIKSSDKTHFSTHVAAMTEELASVVLDPSNKLAKAD